jgi:hypothetical protein
MTVPFRMGTRLGGGEILFRESLHLTQNDPTQLGPGLYQGVLGSKTLVSSSKAFRSKYLICHRQGRPPQDLWDKDQAFLVDCVKDARN